ncbi:MAG: hypothetical protein VYE22_04880 [Myxococcota bacterium]|nr:hypothetical protein [Myxococcota bacterium]
MRLIPLLLLLSAGCAADVASSAAPLEAELESVDLDRARLALLPAGCEDLEGEVRATPEPGLGVLVDPRGALLCVDSLGLLRREAAERRQYVHGPRHDPTPTPLLPTGLGVEPDPTPTPITLPTRP